MAQFNFINELNSALRMDDPITKGPLPRWQRKVLEGSSSNNSTINSSMNKSKSKTPNKLDMKKTPSKTPKPSPARGKSPCGGDRFIPNRSATDFNMGHFKLTLDDNDEAENELKSPNKLEQERIMKENLHGGHDPSKTRILAFQKKAPLPADGHQNHLKVVYSQSKTPSSKSTSRYIPQAPDRILDAPEIVDDYYLNLIDWSQRNNILAVALSNSVYLWNAATGTINHLVELEGSDYVCSLSWVKESDMLAIGTSLGDIQVWDAAQSKRLRVMDGHSARVASLSWNSYILSSGCRSGIIVHHDVRQRNHNVAQINAHSQEVCGLKWSPDGKYLASGGNDNVLNIWQSVQDDFYSQANPLHSFRLHQAAVKALAWCPWQAGLLASGGGTADRHIRLWNCNTGVNTLSIDTKSQVCGLLWSPTFKEIISGHGYANNELIIWKYPSMTKVAELTGHTARVLHLAMSPDGTTVLSAGADETLRLWKCFASDPKQKKELTDSKLLGNSIFKRGIR
ncbi:cell division cycle protein 20 homolog [Cimex lectularius]|uniref:CDC20/Fizzy WD40 domain-containing protein n=1 Tax=Cimex lectularius TaxID=79782 RepID=A0A8I6S0H5_CIMLE|nr:cell division cycle protein 20 homolog [Cimex lectularius]